MKYLLIVGSEGMAAPEDVAVMQREIPGWVEEMDRRGVRLLGRPDEPARRSARPAQPFRDERDRG